MSSVYSHSPATLLPTDHCQSVLCICESISILFACFYYIPHISEITLYVSFSQGLISCDLDSPRPKPSLTFRPGVSFDVSVIRGGECTLWEQFQPLAAGHTHPKQRAHEMQSNAQDDTVQKISLFLQNNPLLTSLISMSFRPPMAHASWGQSILQMLN